jgi:hypothetical protein
MIGTGHKGLVAVIAKMLVECWVSWCNIPLRHGRGAKVLDRGR